MWRGYASDGNGVAIVISALSLGLSDAFRSEIVACPVFYETPVEFSQRAFRAFELFDQALTRYASEASLYPDLVVNAFVDLCFYLAVTHKHPGFASEREWRFAWRRHLADPADGFHAYLKPTLSDGDLIERFCFPIRPDTRVSPAAL